ncbi:MAG: rod-binding protein [Parvularculaceae bacterium]|nr:rod-binding protein [Parvularculaceae bacterium]
MELGVQQAGIATGSAHPEADQSIKARSALASSRLDAAAREFEAVFIAQMLEPLFASVETPAIAGGGESEGFFKSLLQENYAKAFAERGGFGLADHVKAALIDIQARAGAAPSETQS